MPKVVTQRDRFRKIFIEPESAGDGARDLADLKGMGQAGTVMISDRRKKYLRFVFEPAEGLAVNDTIPVTDELRAHGTRSHGTFPSAGLAGKRRIGREQFLLHFFYQSAAVAFADGHNKSSFRHFSYIRFYIFAVIPAFWAKRSAAVF